MKACLFPKMSIFNLRAEGGDKRKRKWREGRIFEGGVYLNISVKGGQLFEGRLLFKEIQ